MWVQKLIPFFTAGAILLGGSGCSYTNRGPKLISLTILPADAYVIINGIEYHSVSPQFVEVNPNRTLLITAYKPGYKEAFYAVNNQLSTVGTIDAFGSIFLIPFLGLFSSGAWELKETNIKIELEPLVDPDSVTLQQQETIESKRRAEVKFREQATKQGMPPSPAEDEKLKQELKEQQEKRAAEAAKAVDADNAKEKMIEKLPEPEAPKKTTVEEIQVRPASTFVGTSPYGLKWTKESPEPTQAPTDTAAKAPEKAPEKASPAPAAGALNPPPAPPVLEVKAPVPDAPKPKAPKTPGQAAPTPAVKPPAVKPKAPEAEKTAPAASAPTAKNPVPDTQKTVAPETKANTP